jgi:hypothetical protein
MRTTLTGQNCIRFRSGVGLCPLGRVSKMDSVVFGYQVVTNHGMVPSKAQGLLLQFIKRPDNLSCKRWALGGLRVVE